jgi:carboxyl-terminal processing protease
MIDRIATTMLLLLLLSGRLALPLHATETTPASDKNPLTENSDRPIPAFRPVAPGPVDGRIAQITAMMLEQMHYTKQKFDTSVSTKFFDRYLDALDMWHTHFVQADLQEFDHYRTNLDRLTITRHGVGDTTPADEIFNRYIEHIEQHVAYVEQVLETNKFKFDSDDRITLNRHDLPYPKDLDEARKLWLQRLKFEYLSEHLAKIDARKRAAATAGTKGAPAAESKGKTEDEEIVETLTRRYHSFLRTYVEMNDEDVLQIYLTTLAHVYDPHSDYMGAPQLDSFAITMNLSLFGIGAELSAEDGYCSIRRLLPGGPAERSKQIKEKDRIVAVAQSNGPPVDVVDMRLDKAVQLIRGPKGTEVRLTIVPAGASASTSKVLSLIRDEIKLEDQEAKAKIIDLPDPHGGNLRLGVIDLPSFYAPFDPTNTRDKSEPKSTTADVSRLINKMKEQNVDGVVLDLRRNGGGSLEEAIRLTGLFIKEGPVVQVRELVYNRESGRLEPHVQVDDDTDPSVLYDGPLIVLTSRFSASASEIVAGALQDYGRALIVGESSTHGKGTVQAVNPLRPAMQLPSYMMTNDPGALKLTIKKFYRASGASTQLKGVIPDIILPSKWNEAKDIGEAALENPLPWDTIPSAKFEHLNRVEPYVAELQRHSAERIAADKEFDYVHEDIELFKKQQADKTVSLNEKQWLKERAEAEAREKARDKERLSRKEPAEKVYELTVKQAALPGLPPPVEKATFAAAKPDKARVAGTRGSNLVSLAASPPNDRAIDAKPGEDAAEAKPPAIDVELVETEHILVDYLSVLGKTPGLTATTAPNH